MFAAPEEGKEFAARWLPAWTGNDPERLVSFYTDDAFYSDPAVPDGVEGREALLAYFTSSWAATRTGSGRMSVRSPSRTDS